MPIETVTVTRLADLWFGDRIESWDGNKYDPPRLVIGELGLIEPGSPVKGVRLHNPTAGDLVEHVPYPFQMDGRTLEVDRYIP